MAEFNKNDITRTSNWFKNVAKSLGYASYDVVKDKMPFVMATFEDNKSIITDTKQLLRSNRGSTTRLANILGTTAAKNIDSFKIGGKNALEDFKSGKIYNKARETEAILGTGGFDDFDDIFSDGYTDDDISVEIEETESDKPNIIINSNINENNPMVTAIKGQSDLILETAKVTSKQNAIIADVQLKSMSNFVQQLHGGLTTINENVSRVVDFNSNHMTSYVGASLKFYDTQISLMGDVITELKKMTAVTGKKEVDKYQSPIDDVMGDYGGFSLSNYFKLVKKQLNNALDGTMFGGTLKTMFGTEDAFLELVNNPLAIIPKTVISKMIPEMTSKIMESFNKSFENFIPLFFDRIYQWGENKNDPSGIASFIGRTLGVNTSVYTSIDPGKYEKGAIPFDGVTKKAITNVIPTYLRKILAHLTGHDELVYNSDNGKWTTLATVKKDFNKEMNRIATREYSDIYDLESRVSKLNLDYDEQARFNESIRNFFAGLSKSNVGFNPNAKSGDANDLIEMYFKDNSDVTDHQMAEMFRKMIKSLPKSAQMRIAREQLSGRVSVRNWVNEKEANPDTLSDIVSSGIMDDSLYKAKSQIEANNAVRGNAGRNRTDARSLSDYGEYTQDQINELLNGTSPTQSDSNRTGFRKFIEEKFGKLTNAVNNVLIKGDNALYRIIFGKETTDDIDTDGSFVGTLMSGIHKSFNKFFNWFEKGFNKISDRLVGDNGLITKLEQTEFMKKLKSGATKTKDYLFGSKDENGNYHGGLLSDVGNELSNMKNSVKNYIMGPDNENSVLNNIKNMFGSFRTSVNDFLFGENGVDGAKDKAKGVLSDFSDSLRDGFQSFANAFFGTTDKLKDGKLQNKVNIDELTSKLKDFAPKGIAGGIVGGGLGLIASAGGFGLLGSLFLGPMSGVVLGVGASLLSRSERFKNMLFGEHDENGERTGGFISKSVQNFFRDNKNYLIGGAALGTASGILGGLGVLPALVAGGPITGAIFGLGAAMLRKSESFQSFMFGDLDDDGKRRGGLITKLTNAVNSDQAMKKLGHAGAGAIIGGIGGATLGSFGLLGSLSLGPLGGAIVGAGAGIALAADKWKEKIFGKFDEDGNRTEAGLLSKLAVMTSVNVLQPLKYKTMEWRFGVENWFEQKIALPIIEAVDPIKEEFHRIGNKLVDFVGGVAETFHIPDIANGLKNNLFVPVANSVKKVANTAVDGIGKVTGWVLQKPAELVSMVVDRIIVPKHMRDGLRDARKMILKNIADSKPGQMVTKTVTTVGNFTKGVISGVGDFAKTIIKGTFSFLGKGLLAVVKAPFQAISLPIKTIGKLGDMLSNRNVNYGSQETLHDIRSGNRGFLGSIGDLAQTFNPFSNIRASAKYQGVDMDALRERAIKEKFTDKDGNIIPHSEKDLDKEVRRLARKYPGGASYQEDRNRKSSEYRNKISDRAKKRREILEDYKNRIQKNQEFASGLGYNLLSDEDKASVSLKDLNKIEDSVYRKVYGKDYKNKSKFEQDRFKSQQASENATIKMAGAVEDIRNALLGQGAKVNVVNDSSDNISDNPITDSMSSSSDSLIDLDNNTNKSGALARLTSRSESDQYYKNYLTDGVTWAEQKQEREAEEQEKGRQNIFQKILGSLEHGNETRDKSAFDWGKIFSKTGLITAGLLAALPFILNFFKDPSGALSGLVNGLGGFILESFGLKDNDGNRTDSSGNTQVNNNMVESGVRGGGQIASVGSRATATGINAAMKAAEKIRNHTSNLYNNVTKNRQTASNIVDDTLALGAGTTDEQAKGITKFMQLLKTLPSKFASFVESKFSKVKSSSAITKIVNLIDNAAAKITAKTLQGNYSRIARALSYAVPGLNIVAGALDIGFVTYGIISGGTKSETANLFHVAQKDVTAGMRTVSAGLKGMLNYSWAFAFAIVCDLAYEMTGYDLLHNIAVIIYKYLLPNTDDSKLDSKISGFRTEYDQYTLKEQIKKGNVTYDENGNAQYTEGAQIESFDSFNDRENKTLWAKMKEKLTGKPESDLSKDDKQAQIESIELAFSNGAIDKKTYDEMISDINGDRGLFGRISDKVGTFVAGINTAGAKWLNEPLLDEDGQPVIDPYTNQPVPKNMIRRLIQNTFDGNLGKRVGDFAKQINDAGSKWWNDPLLDKDGNPVLDPYSKQPVYKNALHRMVTNTFDGNLSKRAGDFLKQINDAGSKWWNAPLLDEEGNPVLDPYSNQPVYKNALHRLVTNTFDGNLSKRVGDFLEQINNAGSKWFNKELNFIDPITKKKVKVKEIGTYIINSFMSIPSKIGEFFSNFFDNSDSSTKGRNFWDNGTAISSGNTEWNNYWMDQAIGGADVPTGATKAAVQASNKQNNNSASYKKKLEELIGLYRISSNYGMRYIGGKNKMHNGIDLVNANNAPVPSFTDGTVVNVVKGYAPDSGYYGNSDGGQFGNHVKIKDNRGNTSIYAHLNGTNVSKGQKISMGQQVGIQGHTGSSTGSHLHYEVRKGDTRQSMNPFNYLRNNFSTSDIGNTYMGSASSGDTMSIDGGMTSTPAVDKLGLATMISALSTEISSSLEPLSAISTDMNTVLGDYFGTNAPTTTMGSSDSIAGINTSGGSLSSGNSGSADANAKRVYQFLRGYGIPDVNIAGVLGNWRKESGIDPTAVESIYNEPYTMGSRKTAAMANPGAFTQGLFAQYAKQNFPINRNAYKGDDGIYYPGIGLGGFTGPAATKLIKFAKAHGKNWYDLDPQLKFATVPTSEGGYRNFMSKWKTSESSPAQSARRFLKDWEGISPNIAGIKLGERQQYAQYYYNKMKEWAQGTGVGGSENDGVVPAFGELPGINIDNNRISSVIDGSGDGNSPIKMQLDENFKKIFKRINGINDILKNNQNVKFNNNFETVTYTPQTKSTNDFGVGGAEDSEVNLPDKIYEILNNMVTYLSNIASNTAETKSNTGYIKTISDRSSKSSSKKSNSINESSTNNTMLDIANKQKQAKSSDGYKNARLIASGIH